MNLKEFTPYTIVWVARNGKHDHALEALGLWRFSGWSCSVAEELADGQTIYILEQED